MTLWHPNPKGALDNSVFIHPFAEQAECLVCGDVHCFLPVLSRESFKSEH